MMAVFHRALFTWFTYLVFFILLTLRLEQRTSWNWFIVFIPLWVYDSFLFIYVVFNMVSHCSSSPDRLTSTIKKKLWYMLAILIKVAAQVVLCLKLEYPSWNVSLYYIMIPLWTLLPALSTEVFIHLIKHAQY